MDGVTLRIGACCHRMNQWNIANRPRFNSYFSALSGLLSVQDANWMVKGEENYAWFGFSLDSCQLENVTLLLIGSPTWRSCAGCVV